MEIEFEVICGDRSINRSCGVDFLAPRAQLTDPLCTHTIRLIDAGFDNLTGDLDLAYFRSFNQLSIDKSSSAECRLADVVFASPLVEKGEFYTEPVG